MVKLVWYRSRGPFSISYRYGIRVSWYYLFKTFDFVGKYTCSCAASEKENFALNFIIKQNPFGPTKGATRCVAAVPPIDNNQDYGAPYLRDSLLHM